MARTCKTILYTGRVQGVGFRMTAQQTAAGFDVTGYVRNTPDGRVELVAEGEPDQVDAFTDAVAERMGGHITDTQISQSEASGRFEGFGVRY